ncbi:roadblock/LC7 domain-containing protein [Streptomyces canus]|uniref:roadblock/LC7 domain-containing protein n=1 Tax=Streptomyces canus TaxID=58343 RepID=UPI002257037F|nr:roadblock/LC7 domain-containing protein [Streptomyces canus]MCX4853693.1 roadblock/LC7 domain-containing protein [Streptomyces canus]
MTASRPDLAWILDGLVNAPHARHALLLSADGLPVAHSDGCHTDLADKIAATVSGLQALSRSGGLFVSDENTTWQQTMVQYGAGYLFVIAAGSGAHLVASAGADVDIAGFSYRMADIVKRLPEALAVAPREHSPQG